MVVTDQKMNTSLFIDDLKKPTKTLSISKRNIFFIVFAVIALQVSDAAVHWLMGGHSGLHSLFSGDSVLFSAAMFVILKCAYDECVRAGCTKCNKEELHTEENEEEEDYRKSATCVVDTMKVKGPPPSSRTCTRPSTRIQKKGFQIQQQLKNIMQQPQQLGYEAPIWVASWWRATCLNPKASKFTPLCTYGPGMLTSSSAPFWPQEMAKKEEELLKSESGSRDAGEVVYRSNYWMTEIGFENMQKDSLPLKAEKMQKLGKKDAPKWSKSKVQKPQQGKWVQKSSMN